MFTTIVDDQNQSNLPPNIFHFIRQSIILQGKQYAYLLPVSQTRNKTSQRPFYLYMNIRYLDSYFRSYHFTQFSAHGDNFLFEPHMKCVLDTYKTIGDIRNSALQIKLDPEFILIIITGSLIWDQIAGFGFLLRLKLRVSMSSDIYAQSYRLPHSSHRG